MTDERTEDYIMCDTPEKIQLFRLLALKARPQGLRSKQVCESGVVHLTLS